MLKLFIKPLISHIKLVIHQNEWRKFNKHNYTTAVNIFPREKVTVGKNTYGQLNVKFFGNNEECVQIGNYCSIAQGVKILSGGNHIYNYLSTFPFKNQILRDGTIEATTKGPVIIKDDVWVGENSLILSGVTIAQGAIIAAGSVVTKNVPPYAIFAGGKIVRYRFSDEIITKLLKIDYASLNEELIKDNINFLYKNFREEMLEDDFL